MQSTLLVVLFNLNQRKRERRKKRREEKVAFSRTRVVKVGEQKFYRISLAVQNILPLRLTPISKIPSSHAANNVLESPLNAKPVVRGPTSVPFLFLAMR
jgi:hypothetical protein